MSPHRAQFVGVDTDVRLEVLDWGGSGRPIVLLTGSGLTAHIYDEFAPKLTDCCHVYGITRRGVGPSSHPDSGYDDQRLADDVLRVLETLKLQAPILVGHSMAGGELTTLGRQHSSRLGGLVYLDALADPRDAPAMDPAWRALADKMPPPSRARRPADQSSFAAYRAWQADGTGGVFPESELRQLYQTKPDGSMGRYSASSGAISKAIGEGQKRRDYSGIRVPVLAISDGARSFNPSLTVNDPRLGPDDPHPRNEEELASAVVFMKATEAYLTRWRENLKRSVPDARFVELPGAGHDLFLTREAEVLREIRTFIASLPPR